MKKRMRKKNSTHDAVRLLFRISLLLATCFGARIPSVMWRFCYIQTTYVDSPNKNEHTHASCTHTHTWGKKLHVVVVVKLCYRTICTRRLESAHCSSIYSIRYFDKTDEEQNVFFCDGIWINVFCFCNGNWNNDFCCVWENVMEFRSKSNAIWAIVMY